MALLLPLAALRFLLLEVAGLELLLAAAVVGRAERGRLEGMDPCD